MKSRICKRILLICSGLTFVFLSCNPEFKASKIPELKLLLFPGGLTGTGTSSDSTCLWDTGVWDTCTWSD